MNVPGGLIIETRPQTSQDKTVLGGSPNRVITIIKLAKIVLEFIPQAELSAEDELVGSRLGRTALRNENAY